MNSTPTVLYSSSASSPPNRPSSIIGPQDAQHLLPVGHVEPVGQIRLRVLPLNCVPITWRRHLASGQLIERRPMTKGPIIYLELNHPHGIALNFQRAVFAKERQYMVTDRERLVVAG